MSGLFGDIDAAEIPDNPFYIAPDVYYCVLSEAKVQSKKDNSGEGLAFKWVIEDDTNEYDGMQVNDWLNIVRVNDASEIDRNVRMQQSRMKQRLTEMGLSTEEMNTLLEPGNLDELVGLHAYVEVVETPDKNDPDKKYTNIRKVSLEDPADS